MPEYDNQQLFTMLILEGAQAGLNWITILRKRETYLAAFDQFDPEKIARYDDVKIAELLQNPGIIRNKLKVNSAIKNAQAYLRIMEEKGSFSDFIWQFVDGRPIQNSWQTMEEVPTQTDESQAMSKTLKKCGFNFVGPTIMYAFMQAIGMVNDHLVDCFRHEACRTSRIG